MELQIQNLKKSYGTHTVLDIGSLTVHDGGITAVVGPNGAGKSTLLNILAGLMKSDDGEVYYGGSREIPFQKMTMVFQEPCLISSTVEKNIAYPLKLRKYSGKEIHSRVGTLAAELGLTHLLGRRTEGLSLGEVQKTALARALSFEPELLFLDEPCASIDPHATLEIEEMLLKRKREKGTTILIITHDLAQAGRLADQVVLLKEGKVVEACGAEKFFSHPDKEETRKFTGGELLV